MRFFWIYACSSKASRNYSLELDDYLHILLKHLTFFILFGVFLPICFELIQKLGFVHIHKCLEKLSLFDLDWDLDEGIHLFEATVL